MLDHSWTLKMYTSTIVNDLSVQKAAASLLGFNNTSELHPGLTRNKQKRKLLFKENHTANLASYNL